VQLSLLTFNVVSVAAQCFRAGLPWISLWIAGAAGFDAQLGKLVNLETLQIAIIALLQKEEDLFKQRYL
jgi:hypothetical protein